MMLKSKVKAKLRANEPAGIVCLHLTDPSVYELVGLMGWDGIWMDLEHHGYSVETAQHLMRAARVGGADIMARPGKGEFMRMGRLLESGATGILYPRCDDGAEAREVVRWSKFAPLGERGIDCANPDNPYLLTDLATYIKRANDETFIVIQIEDIRVAERAEEIAAVEGVDVLFIGPGDMSTLAGIPGQWDHPLIQNAIRQVARACEKAGKHWGTSVGTRDRVKQVLDMGARLVCHGADIVGLKAFLEQTHATMESLGIRLDPGAQRYT